MDIKKHLIHEKETFENIRDLVERACAKHGDAIAYSYKENPRDKENKKKSFIELRDDVRALASKLVALGVAGKHCALIGKFSYQWVLTYFSVLSAGGVLVPLDRDWTANDLADTVKRADAEFLIVDADIKDKADVIAESAGISNVIYTSGDTEPTVNSFISEGGELFANSPETYFDAKIDPLGLSLLVFTSGTTGKGKGVMLSQNAVLSDMSSVIPYIDFAKKTVGVLPPHHTFGSSVMLVGHLMIGTEIYISQGLRYVAKEFKEEKPGHLILVPLYLETFYRKMQSGIKEQGKEKLVKRMMKLSNFLLKFGIDIRKKVFASLRSAMGGELKMAITGGAPINSEIIEFFEGIGVTTLNGYGITECAPIIAVNHSKKTIPGSVGWVIDIDNVKISEPNEDGEGEICVKGSNVMLGYYKDEENTREAFDEDGYFKTGDYGKIDKNGALHITGRKKNLIILSNGKNVYPEEIEAEFAAVAGLLDIIVYEGQSKRGLEHNAIVAEIYPDKDVLLKNGIDDPEAYFKGFVDNYNRTAVPYKKIAIVKVRDEEFPKNTLRKILRFKLDMTID